MVATRALLLVSFAVSAQAECSADTHHPENRGYYIEGINGFDYDAPAGTNGAYAHDITWSVANEDDGSTYYPHGEMMLCEGIYCSSYASTVGSPQYIYAHTCARLRFAFTASSGTTVYELPDQAALDTCDFSSATLLANTDAGEPYYDYYIEADAEKKIHYFASQAGCADGVKVAVWVYDDYLSNYDTCYSMGTTSSRIQHCDCDLHIRPNSLTEPCHTGFVQGCFDSMPDDLSCCPTSINANGEDATFVDGAYVNGGTCVSTGLEYTARMDQAAKDVHKALACGLTADWDAGDCPSDYHGTLDHACTMYKSVLRCGLAAEQPQDCMYDRYWAHYELAEPTLDVFTYTAQDCTGEAADDGDGKKVSDAVIIGATVGGSVAVLVVLGLWAMCKTKGAAKMPSAAPQAAPKESAAAA